MKNILIGIAVIIVIIIGVRVFSERAGAPIDTNSNMPPMQTGTSTDGMTTGTTTTNAPSDVVGTLATTNDIVVSVPSANQTISSPVKLSGKARGGWFFEASAPVMIVDDKGTLIGQGHIEAKGDWMTSEFVDFEGSVTFKNDLNADHGFVVFMNDNPSGMPENAKYVRVPVMFK